MEYVDILIAMNRPDSANNTLIFKAAGWGVSGKKVLTKEMPNGKLCLVNKSGCIIAENLDSVEHCKDSQLILKFFGVKVPLDLKKILLHHGLIQSCIHEQKLPISSPERHVLHAAKTLLCQMDKNLKRIARQRAENQAPGRGVDSEKSSPRPFEYGSVSPSHSY